MALLIKDRVLETCSSPGTGAVTLLGAVTGYQSFSTAFSSTNGTTTYYCIADQGGANWEVGLGTWNTGNTFTRTTVYASSNAGATVNFASGTQNVFCTYPAEQALYLGGPLGTPSSGTVTNLTGTASININGTVGATTQNTGAFTTLTSTSDATLHGLTVGLGGGSVSTNTAVGVSALNANTSGANNTAIGYQAAYSNTSGGQITAVGYQAGYTSNSVGGTYLTAVGFKAAYTSSTTGTICAIGYNALTANTSGADNTAVGSYNALGSNTTGSYNTAVGREALNSNTTASNNTAVGYQAGYSQTTGGTSAGYNAYFGQSAGYASTGYQNTLIGRNSGSAITSGNSNTLIGQYNGNQGGLDIRTSNNYIVLSDGDGNPRGYYSSSANGWVFPAASSSATPVQTVGASGDAAYQAILITKYDNNSTTSQNFIQFQINNGGVNSGKITANGANQATFTSTSDVTLKTNIVPLASQLANINAIEVIEFDYIESEGGGHQIGFSAQNMQTIYPDTVSTREDGKLELSGWNKTEARLVKAIQELSALVTAQATEIAALKAKVGA